LNYYERHIGDYLKDTAHLSLLEHGIYGRLLDVYYTRESPIPRAQVERLIGVRSKEERSALECVLSEFFQVDGGVLRHSRCDREIERYQGKQIKAAASANARWNKQKKGGDRMQNADADGMRTHMRTHCEGNAPRHQTPDTSNQYQRAPLLNEEGGGQPIGPDGPAPAGFENREQGPDAGTVRPAEAAVQAMAGKGLADTSPGNPQLLALLSAGITLPELEDAAAAAVKAGKGFAWALARAMGKRRDAASNSALPEPCRPHPDSRGAIEADGERLGIGRWQQIDGDGRTVTWPAYAERVRAARGAEQGEGAAA
jgi:uncharacterized protein YdaU (DUF1376 family)